ncbi:MAG: saccharopine dehydrogenase [Burkholderiales bacterium PBB5]|nr:MAG: saccharopine dehydrogenase [Burkholderiales bacterium PBB5]
MSTSNKHPVVVYGASGYTGRLVCEYLREHGIPFTAAGRSASKIDAAMRAHVPGIETARYNVVEVLHTTEALTELFRGAQVVLNTVGPFATHGTEVVAACLAAGCHYTDTTGEQDWLITLDEQFGARFAAAGLLLSPGLAHMYTTGEIAAQLCLETPGLDTLDIAVFWGGSPTIASTQTILVNAAMAKAYHLEQNQYVEWPADGGLYSLALPGQHEAALALPWGGTSHPVWFKRDPRVANVKVLGGVFNKALMQGVPQIVAAAMKATEGMNPQARHAALVQTAASVMNTMPPRENPRINKSVDSVHASGPLARAHCVIYGNCNYKQTGLLQAFAAASLLQQPPRRVGFASGCQAFGHHELLGALRSFGLVQAPVLSVHR